MTHSPTSTTVIVSTATTATGLSLTVRTRTWTCDAGCPHSITEVSIGGVVIPDGPWVQDVLATAARVSTRATHTGGAA